MAKRVSGARRMGNRSIFSPKDGDRFQGETTTCGSAAFEDARGRLALLAGRGTAQVSDGDTIEYLARGDKATRRYLKGRA